MNLAEFTLYEQMRINDVELQRRREQLQLTSASLALLPRFKNLVGIHARSLVDAFYSRQLAMEEVQLIIGDEETLKRLKIAQHSYILELFGGDYGVKYANTRLRIGMVHKRLGVEPKLFLAAMRNLRQVFLEFFEIQISDPVERDALMEALDKLFFYDMSLVFDTYIQSLVVEARLASDKSERYVAALEEKYALRTRELEDLVRRDSLTGLFNQGVLREILSQEIAMAQRTRQSLGLVYMDADNFKEINDRIGHLKGDEILVTTARLIKKHVGHDNFAFRYGGDEFCALLIGYTEDMLHDWCGAWAAELEALCSGVHFSIGYVQIGPENYLGVEDFIDAADKRMYAEKNRSKSWRFGSPDSATAS
ncbi:MAG: GGDEF domain-containing protein [Leptospirales bacterium]|nr:GGDEF domain-containing protein [Leptospirales bacterium]